MVAWQLGNLYLLMAFMGLFILNTTSEAKVVRAYLLALWLGDIGHVGFSAYGLGIERLFNVAQWNALTGGNVAFTVRCPVIRSVKEPNDAEAVIGIPLLDPVGLLSWYVRTGLRPPGFGTEEEGLRDEARVKPAARRRAFPCASVAFA